MKSLISQLKTDYPQFSFVPGAQFVWSPRKQQITYRTSVVASDQGKWTLLHELGHAQAAHGSYSSDLELLKIEAEAWETAKQLGTSYNITVAEDHIQDCMDTYRDWVHERSKCPRCNSISLQKDARHYQCFNCTHQWSVTNSRFCRPYRRSEHKKTSPDHKEQAMFL